MSERSVGFIGLGVMGEPMARNLLGAGTPLVAWNRSEPALARVGELGAAVAATPSEVFARCDTVIMMLANGEAADEVLGRSTPRFASDLAGRTLVHMGTTPPAWSAGLRRDVQAVGGRYVEAPVSGSRAPAEAGTLVGMLAGDPEDVERVQAIIAPMCRQTFLCGSVPAALTTKLAVNLFLITMVTGLVEAAHFAACLGVDLDLFRQVLDAGPMASEVSRVKLAKLVATDYDPQAQLSDVLFNCGLVADAARRANISTPLLDQSHQLFAESDGMGLGPLDMIGISGALEQLTSNLRTHTLHEQFAA